MSASPFDPARIDGLVAEMERMFASQWHPKVQHCFRRVKMTPPPYAATDPDANCLRVRIGLRGDRRDFTGS